MDRDLKSLLTIKVLRLVKPSLIGPLPLSSDPRDLVGDLWERELKGDVTASPGVEALSLGQFLRLPQGFGNLYLGETFTCYVVIQNESPLAVTNASVRVDLQTNSQKFTLAENKIPPLLKPGDTIDLIMSHEIKEMGKHMLICTLTYGVPSSSLGSGEPIFVERFFKFQVKKPLDVKTKLYNAEGDEVFLEAQVQNITAAPIVLEKVDLEPSLAFSCLPLRDTGEEREVLLRARMGIPSMVKDKFVLQQNNNNWPSPHILLDVEASHQFLYRLVPKVDTAKAITSIGKLDIVWKTSMGSSGRLQTSQLQRQITPMTDLRVVVEKVPETSVVDQPFSASCKVINTTSDREMELRLELDSQTEGFCWLGLTKSKLGPLPPTAQLELKVQVFPIRTGLINLSGIKLVDLKRGEKFCFNDLVQVLVLQS